MPIFCECLLAVTVCVAVLNACTTDEPDRVELVTTPTTQARTVGHYNEVVRMRELVDRAREARAERDALVFADAVATFAGEVGRSHATRPEAARGPITPTSPAPTPSGITFTDGAALIEDNGRLCYGPCAPWTTPCAIPEHICRRESGGWVNVKNRSSSSSGKYQFIDGTWAGYGGYEHAGQAPEAVQDEKAAALYAGGAGCGHWASCG